tara:strand:+ start:3140 stop:3811 length:672 start_codon:yes stop_codon:yes gene_type:complete
MELDTDYTGNYKNDPKIIKLTQDESNHYFNNKDTSKQFLLTDIGKYSISKPHLAQWITLKIITCLNLSLEEIKNKMTITDATAGLGGDLFTFAHYFKKVNGVEQNLIHFNVLNHNLQQLACKNITMYNKNYYNIYEQLDNNIVFIDPPWGGNNSKVYKYLNLYLDGKNISKIINLLYKINVEHVFLKIPFNFNFSLLLQTVLYNNMSIHRYKNIYLVYLQKKI